MSRFIEVKAHNVKEKWTINVDSISFIIPDHKVTFADPRYPETAMTKSKPAEIHFIGDNLPLTVDETYEQLKEFLANNN